MSQSDGYSDSTDSQYQLQQNKNFNQFVVSILRYLPEARKIMQGHNYQHQTTRCIYQQPLISTPSFIIPRSLTTQTPHLLNNRLVKLQDIIFQHQKIKNLFKSPDHKKPPQSLISLWNMYSKLPYSYSRFGLTIKKSNFANVLLPINGINIILGTKYTDRILQQQKKILSLSPDTIKFDSHFQSGNLLYVYRKQINQIQTYDLILQNDINTKGHNQWFFFKVYNTKQHNKICFNIINFIKDQSMFSYGIKPLVFSERDYRKHRLGWVRDGDKVHYYQNNYKRQANTNCYYTLTFQYYFRQIDTVYFAPVHPYTYSQLTQYYDNIMNQYSSANFISIKTIAQSIGRNAISIVTFGTGKKHIKDCNVIWILGRQHPGQTTSSYMIQGMINYLISLYSNPSSIKSQYLDNLIIKIVPMLNVDGVIHGNTRTQLTGVDPNRMWKKTLKRLSPAVSIIKKLIYQYKQNIQLILDLHSHSKKLGCFFYGNSIMHDPKKNKIYPTFVCENDERFQLKNCRFRGGYDTTARSVLFSQMGIKQVYTVQCSLLGYLKKNRITEYKISDYHEMGRKLIQCYLQLQKQKNIKSQNQILSSINNIIINSQDPQSARSQSNLSDQEYQQIKHKSKKNKKRKHKKCYNENLPSTTTEALNPHHSQNSKYYIKRTSRTNTRPQLAHNDKKRRCFNRQTCINELNQKNQNLINLKFLQNKYQGLKRSSTMGLNDSLSKIDISLKVNRQHRNQQRRTYNNSNITKPKYDSLPTSTKDPPKPLPKQKKQVSIQVNINIQKQQPKKPRVKSRAQKSLCVVGSSLEDQLFYLGKNQVGIQLYQQLIHQSTSLALTNFNRKSMKLKKIPKLLNYLCSNLIGTSQNNNNNTSLYQDKKLLPIFNKKYASNSKN